MTDKPTHTPGPWRVDTWAYTNSDTQKPRKELVIENGKFRIAVLECDHDGDNPYTIPRDEAEANARLFAAVPDLLAALTQIAEQRFLIDDDSDERDQMVEVARVVIEKAVGESRTTDKPTLASIGISATKVDVLISEAFEGNRGFQGQDVWRATLVVGPRRLRREDAIEDAKRAARIFHSAQERASEAAEERHESQAEQINSDQGAS